MVTVDNDRVNDTGKPSKVEKFKNRDAEQKRFGNHSNLEMFSCVDIKWTIK